MSFSVFLEDTSIRLFFLGIFFFFFDQFDDQGYAIIKDFLTEEEVQSLRNEMADIMKKLDPSEHRCVFRTLNQVTSQQFADSDSKM